MTDLRLDINGDLDFSANNLYMITGLDYVAQRVALRLSAQTGDWFLDLLFGLPWRESILVRNPDLVEIGALFRAQIVSTPEITRLVEFSIDFDNVTGELSIRFWALTPYGEAIATATGDDLTTLISTLLFVPLGGIV